MGYKTGNAEGINLFPVSLTTIFYVMIVGKTSMWLCLAQDSIATHQHIQVLFIQDFFNIFQISWNIFFTYIRINSKMWK